jgi:hypothetical protein
MRETSNNTTNRGGPITTRGKTIAIHSLIFIAFVFFLIFAAEPLFEKINNIINTASLLNLRLPAETNNITIAVDHIAVRDQLIEIEGWSFIEGQNTDNSEIFLVLKSNLGTYVFNTQKRIRHDVTLIVGESKLSLDNSGYIAFIPKDKLVQGEYFLGIYIRKNNDIEALAYSNKTIQVEAQIQDIFLPSITNNINRNIESVDTINEKIKIKGWAFIESQNSENSRTYLVLKSDVGTFIFDTIPQERTDVTNAFSTLNLNLDNSGFSLTIPREKIPEKEYTIGLFIIKGNTRALEYTDRTLQIEAKLQNMSLPLESNNISYNIENVATLDNKIKIKGWAFIKGQDTEKIKIYVVLKSATGTYVFDTVPQKRTDITGAFFKLNLNLDNAGFSAVISPETLPYREYTIGVYIQKGDIQALEFTNRILQGEAKLQKISLPSETSNISYNIENFENQANKIEIKGWAFIEGQDAERSRIYLVLKSASETYVFDAVPQKRTDVTQYFSESNLDLDNSGFSATISSTPFIAGEYTLGIYIQNETGALIFTDKVWETP